jgi:putative transposase
VYRESLDAVLHRLDLSFMAFFRRLRAGEKPGFPRFKARSRWNQIAFPHGNRALRLDARQTRVLVPGVGAVKLRKGRTIPLTYGRAWLYRRNDRWYACFECEREVQPLPAARRLVAVDRGIHVLAALDDGHLIRNRAVGEQRRRRTARLQRELESVTVRDSAGRVRNGSDLKRVKAVKRLARAKEREANARRDYAHKASREIVDGAEIIALEQLDVQRMTRSAKGTLEKPGRNVAAKAGLNRRLSDSGFGLLARLIAEKAEEAARRLVWVDPRFSSQECSRCEHRAKESRRRRRFLCVACGFTAHADVNAALVIRRRAELPLMRVLSVGPGPVTQHDAA